jgi:hypothetical protein
MPAGRRQFVRRIDRQVKIRGFRAEVDGQATQEASTGCRRGRRTTMLPAKEA